MKCEKYPFYSKNKMSNIMQCSTIYLPNRTFYQRTLILMAFVFVMILHMKIDWSMPHNDNDKRQNSTIDASLNLPKHNNKKNIRSYPHFVSDFSFTSPYSKPISSTIVSLFLLLVLFTTSHQNLCCLDRMYQIIIYVY